MVLTFEDTPLFDWLKQNRFFLLGLAALVIGINGYQYFAPQMKLNKQNEAWSIFDNISGDLAQDLDGNLSASLAQAKEYPSIYPAIVFQATNAALRESNTNALSTLKPILNALTQDKSANSWKALPEGGEPTTIAAVLLDRVNDAGQHASLSWENPEPQGARVSIVISSSDGKTYNLIAGLFEDRAPAACTNFLAAVDNGNFNGLDVVSFGSTVTLNGFQPDAEQDLPLERVHGLFHLAGSLSTTSKPGEPGMQNADSMVIYLRDNAAADGSSTVFGTIVEGLEPLQEALATPASGVTYAIMEVAAL